MAHIIRAFVLFSWLVVAAKSDYWLVTVQEAEDAFPELAGCGFNYYGASAYLHFLNHPGRQATPFAETRLVMLPPYFTIEHNWPVYGGGSFAKNMARPGPEAPTENGVCRKVAARLVEWSLERFAGAVVLVHDGSGDWADGYDAPGITLEANPRVIVAKGDALATRFRPKWDISMPPPMSESMGRVRNTRDLWVHRAPTRKLGFKGTFNHATRKRAAAALHKPERGFFVVPTSDNSFDYNDMIGSSEFGLVIRGDVAFSYRFTEVVCGGAIPVVIADNWVIPFDDLVPFASYGLRVSEDNVSGVIPLVESIDAERSASMRKRALRLCHSHLVTQYHQFETLLREAHRRVEHTSTY